MSEKPVCLRCFLIESGMNNVFEDIKEHIEKIPENKKTVPAEYNRRLSVCRKCDDLVGGTCLKCGCYPEFRAAFIANKCPAKRW